MCAKLLDFYGVGFNSNCIAYFFVDSKGKHDVLKYDAVIDPADRAGFIFGAQASMITRNVNIGVYRPGTGFKL